MFHLEIFTEDENEKEEAGSRTRIQSFVIRPNGVAIHRHLQARGHRSDLDACQAIATENCSCLINTRGEIAEIVTTP